MKIGLMGISEDFYKVFCKMSREKQKAYMGVRGDYKHMEASILDIQLNEALKDVPYAATRIKIKTKKINSPSDRGRNESDNIDGQRAEKA